VNGLDKREGTVILRDIIDVVGLRYRKLEGDLQIRHLLRLRRERRARVSSYSVSREPLLIDRAIQRGKAYSVRIQAHRVMFRKPYCIRH